MKRSITIKHITISDAVGVYSLQFSDKTTTEFLDFISKYKDISNPILKEDFNRIVAILKKIIANGALERLFRTREGKIKDGVVAVPLDIVGRRKGCGTLRLYCLRISDEVLILGNGGIKYGNSYNDNAELNSYVTNLAELDRVIRKFTRQGKIKITGKTVILQENLTIEI
ncbi:hypothetical protein [Alistipes finegoldii]|uniref:hypothetical protein n=1 Tax=Alistipes finegoldii TaxID=214856 RepID=UPI0025976768|nr:hypothetical protein [Alistipes finegoldii]